MTRLARADGSERMDAPGVDPGELEESLADLRAVNRWLGARRSVRRHVARLAARRSLRELRVLDVATGSGDIPLALARWGRIAGVRVQVTATDIHPVTLAAARRNTAADPDVAVEPADALSLPFEDRSFDLALCCTALHHFGEEEAVRVLCELNRVARHGILVADLRRSGPALLGAKLLAATAWRRSPITRHDGPLSVRRAFTAAELRMLAARAGCVNSRVRREPLFRLVLTAGGFA